MGVRLHPILSGEIQLRVIAPRRPRRGPAKLQRTLLRSFLRKPGWYPVPVFLVEHPSRGPLLIDVGYDPSVSDDPAQTLGVFFGKFAMKHRVRGDVLGEVRSRGIDPAQVSTVLMTHLHLDHVSASGQWPNAEFAVDRVELATGLGWRGPGPYIRRHLETIDRWRELDFNGPEAEPFETFARTIDFFGDGSVRLISSPGHAPGHQSVLLQLGDRFALILGDAMMSTVELREPVIDGLMLDQDSYIRSGEEARAFMRAHPDTLAIPSHDAELWPTLEPVYD